MSVALDIARTYGAPRRIVRQRSAPPESEARALVTLLAGCLLMFIAQLPLLQRSALAQPEIPFDARFGGALFAWILLMPIVFYALSALSHLVARALGGSGTWYGARMALFWAVLAASPLWLLNGLVAGLIGPGPGLTATGVLASVAFLAIWLIGLWETETAGAPT